MKSSKNNLKISSFLFFLFLSYGSIIIILIAYLFSELIGGDKVSDSISFFIFVIGSVLATMTGLWGILETLTWLKEYGSSEDEEDREDREV